MAEPLGRVLVREQLDAARGPDAHHRITVPGEWIDEAARVEFELPRTLSCAACSGGGCDTCGRSGAVATRGRGEPAELVCVQLPPQPGATVRIANSGGLPLTADDALPRGHLLLRVIAGPQASDGIVRIEPSTPPPPRTLSIRPLMASLRPIAQSLRPVAESLRPIATSLGTSPNRVLIAISSFVIAVLLAVIAALLSR